MDLKKEWNKRTKVCFRFAKIKQKSKMSLEKKGFEHIFVDACKSWESRVARQPFREGSCE